jgi:hypothetical protein
MRIASLLDSHDEGCRPSLAVERRAVEMGSELNDWARQFNLLLGSQVGHDISS